MNATEINEKVFFTHIKINACAQLFAITYANTKLPLYVSKTIKNMIGNIKKNTIDELGFYQKLQVQIISNLPLEIDMANLNDTLSKQKELINDLVQFLNDNYLTVGYKNKMLKCIKSGLLEPSIPPVKEDKQSKITNKK